MFLFLSPRYECFKGKYTSSKIHTKLNPELEWRIFHILTIENIEEVLSRFLRLFVQTVSLSSCLRYEFYFRSHVSNQYFTHSLHLLVKLYFHNLKKNHIFAPPCNIIYRYIYFSPIQVKPLQCNIQTIVKKANMW